MQDHAELLTLIDAASKRAGSDGKLAVMLGVPRQHVSHWRHEHRPCNPENMALMAHIAGLDAIETLARATVKQYEGTAKGDLLMRGDSVAFPPGGCAYRHHHQGPGIRCMIEGGVSTL